MEPNKLIAVEEFCANHDIEQSFILSLQKYGLIEMTTIGKTNYFNAEQLLQMDRFILLYYELNPYSDGIDSIMPLLLQVRRNYRLYDHLKYMS